jgi:lipopolysaccharide exporter
LNVPATPQDPRQGLRAKTLSGLRWSFTSTGVSTLIQIAHMVIMARLLAPADFGLVALATAFLRFGTYFAQLGVGQALMQRLTLSEREIRTAFTTSALLGTFMAAAFYVAAPLAVAVVQAPEVVPVIQMLGLSMVITGLGMAALSLLKRELRFRELALIEVGSYVVGYVFVGITLAVLGFGVWSLVFAALCQGLLQTIAAYAMTRHSSSPLLGWVEIKTIYAYGGKVSATQFLNVSRHALMTSAVGRVAGVSALGLFDRARMLVQLPFEKLEATVTKVLFPAMSRVQTDTQTLAKIFLLQKALVAAVFLPTLAGMAVSADVLIAVLLGPQWFDAAGIVPFLATVVGIVFLGHFSRVIADVKALMNQRLVIESGQLALLAVALLVGTRYGLTGLLIAIIVAEVVAYLAYAHLMQRHLAISWSRLLKTLVPGVVATIVVGVGLAASKTGFYDAGLPAGVVLMAQVVLGGALLTALWISPVFSSLRAEALELVSPRSSLGPEQRLGAGNMIWRLLLGQR